MTGKPVNQTIKLELKFQRKEFRMNSVLKAIQTKVWLKFTIWKIQWVMEGKFFGLPLEDWKHERELFWYDTKEDFWMFIEEEIPCEFFYSPLGAFVRKLRGDTRTSWS
jgi:hypothetical protein